MAWRFKSIMDAKVFFINEYRSGTWTMADLCREVGISRTLGYKYLRRFEQFGFNGLMEINRAPKTCPGSRRNWKTKWLTFARSIPDGAPRSCWSIC